MMRRNREKGQALLIFVILLGAFLLGMLGLAVDATQMYCHRQAAQAAADAAAQAGAMSVLGGTSVTAATVAYAARNGFQASEVTTEQPTAVPGLTPCGEGVTTGCFTSAVKVTITRDVPATFMRILGRTGGRITATAIAALTNNNSAIPLVVLHPKMPASLSIGGNTQIYITGGPCRSVQVNSDTFSPAAFEDGMGSSVIDLRGAGEGEAKCQGTGGDFGVFGGPPDWPSNVYAHEYLSPEPPIPDPLRDVGTPTGGGTAPYDIYESASTSPPDDAANAGCLQLNGNPIGMDASVIRASHPCIVYHPGVYPGGIHIKNQSAVFAPGVYTIINKSGGGNCPGGNQCTNGFTVGSNGAAHMCLNCVEDPDLGAGARMVVYISGSGTFDITANGEVDLKGSAAGSAYKKILFYVDHSVPGHNRDNNPDDPHTISGNAGLFLRGTIYLTNHPQALGDNYQQLYLAGGGCSNTLIEGQIIADAVDLGGGGCVKMELSSAEDFIVSQIALVK